MSRWTRVGINRLLNLVRPRSDRRTEPGLHAVRFMPAQSLGRKVTAVFLVAMISVLLPAGLVQLWTAIQSDRLATRNNLNQIGAILGSTASAALVLNDRVTAREILAAAGADTRILAAAIYDSKGRLFAHYVRPGTEGGIPRPEGAEFSELERVTILTAPIRVDREHLGRIVLRADNGIVEDLIARQIATAGVILLAAMFLTVFLSRFARRVLSDPILRLARVAEHVSREREFSVRAIRESEDEIGSLVDSFNEMLHQLQNRERELLDHRSHLESEVADRTAALTRANSELTLAKDRAEAASHTKGEFLANMSHELRTPLHGILSYAEFGLRDARGGSVEDVEGDLREIREGGVTLMRLLDDLLDLAKLEAGRMTYEMHPGSFMELVDHSLDEFRSRCTAQRIRIELEGPGEDFTVFADNLRIAQVLRNVLGNAAKFARSSILVRVEASPQRDSVSIDVIDDGPGVPADELEAVFDKFVQSSRTKNGAGGTGLGLPISREIMSAHGGHIWALAIGESGGHFRLRLPLWEPEMMLDDLSPTSEAASAA